MDRVIVYPGAIPLDTDLLNTNRNVMVALHGLLAATLGTSTALSGASVATGAVDGFLIAPTLPNSMQVVVGPGTITQLGALDNTPYGSLPADLNDAVYKMGVMLEPLVLSPTPPPTPGIAIAYLVQATFAESDQNPVVLPYYNAANPAQAYLGPGNSGASQATVRRQSVTVQLKAGLPAPFGAQLAPPADAGFIGLGVVVVSQGQTVITQSSILPASAARFTPWKLPDLTPGFAFSQVFVGNGTFAVPPQVTRLRATVIGAGGGGGGCNVANAGGGGGGAGGKGQIWMSGITPGAQIPIIVGGGGVGGASGTGGGTGGTTSFSTFCTATGGVGGGPGTSAGSGLGGVGGTVVGGAVTLNGVPGGNGVPSIACGGLGGNGGNGGNGGSNGTTAPSYGGGGGGGSGAGFSGGAGAGGLVIVEW